MSNRIHALAQQLTSKATIEESSLEEVKHLVKRYPYFAPAQFFLLQKLQQLNANEAQVHGKRALLFYHEPLLFDYFISSEKFYVDEEGLISQKEGAPESTFDVASVPLRDSEASIKPNDAIEEINTPAKLVAVEDRLMHQIADPVVPEAGITDDVSNNVTVKQVAFADDPLIEAVESINVEAVNVESVDGVAQSDRETTSVDTTSELIFEPFHTVDYFASQGIKVSQEELPKDKLSKQLRSFTDWLKTMKRLPAGQIAQDANSIAEKKVQNMASCSVSESEVVTEAMAEVWAKQGNSEKAMETYNKLSLLNPSKTAYFASRIENLKHT